MTEIKLSDHVEHKLVEIAKRLGQEVADATRSSLLASLEQNPEHQISDVDVFRYRLFTEKELESLRVVRNFDFPEPTPGESPSD